MTKREIKDLKSKGYLNDTIYGIAAGRYNLFGAAFFGFKATKAEKQKLEKVWNKIVNTKI